MTAVRASERGFEQGRFPGCVHFSVVERVQEPGGHQHGESGIDDWFGKPDVVVNAIDTRWLKVRISYYAKDTLQ